MGLNFELATPAGTDASCASPRRAGCGAARALAAATARGLPACRRRQYRHLLRRRRHRGGGVDHVAEGRVHHRLGHVVGVSRARQLDVCE